VNTRPIVTNKIFVSIINVILEAKEKKSKDCVSCWVISTAQLNVFPHVHLQPINVVVYNDPYLEDSSSG
jgi:hypothetical protein